MPPFSRRPQEGKRNKECHCAEAVTHGFLTGETETVQTPPARAGPHRAAPSKRKRFPQALHRRKCDCGTCGKSLPHLQVQHECGLESGLRAHPEHICVLLAHERLTGLSVSAQDFLEAAWKREVDPVLGFRGKGQAPRPFLLPGGETPKRETEAMSRMVCRAAQVTATLIP